METSSYLWEAMEEEEERLQAPLLVQEVVEEGEGGPELFDLHPRPQLEEGVAEEEGAHC